MFRRLFATHRLNELSLKAYTTATVQANPVRRDLDTMTFLMITILASFVTMGMFMLPGTAFASGTINLGPPQALNSAFGTAGQNWWKTISVPGFWLAIISSGVLYVLGLTQYLRWGLGAVAFFAFGDKIGKFIMSLGGNSVTG